MTTIIDGSAGITFPAGSNPQAAPSKVLQVVQSVYSSTASTGSSTPTASGLTASITPLFSTSKILIFASLVGGVNSQGANNGQGYFYIYRGTSTSLLQQSIRFYTYVTANGIFMESVDNMTYLDSPATTSSTTYNIYFSNTAGSNTNLNNSSGTSSTLTLMEIAA
jgi:hypothetical protein